MTFLNYIAVFLIVYELYKILEYDSLFKLAFACALSKCTQTSRLKLLERHSLKNKAIFVFMAELIYIVFVVILLFTPCWPMSIFLVTWHYINYRLHIKLKSRIVYTVFNLVSAIAIYIIIKIL